MKKAKRKVKVHYRPAPTSLKILVCLLILSSMVALAALGWVHLGIQKQTQELKQEAAQAENQRQDLQQKIDGLDSVESIRQIAQEDRGLVDPNTIIIKPEEE